MSQLSSTEKYLATFLKGKGNLRQELKGYIGNWIHILAQT